MCSPLLCFSLWMRLFFVFVLDLCLCLHFIFLSHTLHSRGVWKVHKERLWLFLRIATGMQPRVGAIYFSCVFNMANLMMRWKMLQKQWFGWTRWTCRTSRSYLCESILQVGKGTSSVGTRKKSCGKTKRSDPATISNQTKTETAVWMLERISRWENSCEPSILKGICSCVWVTIVYSFFSVWLALQKYNHVCQPIYATKLLSIDTSTYSVSVSLP